MNLAIEIAMLLIATVYIVDCSGLPNALKALLFRALNGSDNQVPFFQLKPFDCSLCMSFWVVGIYSLIAGQGLIYSLFFGVAASFVSKPISYIMRKTFQLWN